MESGKEVFGFSVDGNCLGFDRNGTLVAISENNRSLGIYEAASGKLVRNLPRAAPAWRAHFSPDGRQIAAVSRMGVTLYDVNGEESPVNFPLGIVVVSEAQFSADGKLLAIASTGVSGAQVEAGTVKIWNVATRREVHVLRDHVDRSTIVSYTPDGRRLAVASSNEGIKLWDTATWQEAIDLTGSAQYIAFDSRGHRMAVAGPDFGEIWDATPLPRQPGR
ncbi:MAG: hypothetical protein IH991_14940 [Planctomycetes bacterium]|nr:hypothetical protein [Planctomycetota bacterium]